LQKNMIDLRESRGLKEKYDQFPFE
jgi:hypothetical protein